MQQDWWGRWTEPKVLIGVPSTGTWTEPFARSMLNLIAWLGKDGIEYDVFSTCGSLIAKMRNNVVKHALERGFTHVLFVDTDQTFPYSVVNWLLTHRLPIVAANIATKIIPPQQTACVRPRHKNEPPRMARKLQQTTGVEKCWRVGTGVMLIETGCFERTKYPWFFLRMDESGDMIGEDWYFVERCEEAGIPCYVDHDLSAQVSHVGQFGYRLPHYYNPGVGLRLDEISDDGFMHPSVTAAKRKDKDAKVA